MSVSSKRPGAWLATIVLSFLSCSRPGAIPEQVGSRLHPELVKHLDVVDLLVRYERVPIPDDRNAFPLWSKGIKKLVEYEGMELEEIFVRATNLREPLPTGGAGRLLADWLEENREAIDLIDEGIKRGSCLFPEITGFGANISYVGSLRQAARIKLVRSRMLASSKRFREAGEELVKILRLGEMIVTGEGEILHYYVGVACQAMATLGMCRLADKDDVPERVLERLLDGLKPAPKKDTELAQAFRIEFWGGLMPGLDDVVKALVKAGHSEELMRTLKERVKIEAAEKELEKVVEALVAQDVKPLDVPETLRAASVLYARAIRSATGPWGARDLDIDDDASVYREQLNKDTANAVQALLAAQEKKDDRAAEEALNALAKVLRNPAGKILISMCMPSTNVLLKESFASRTDREGTRAVLALRLYSLRRGRLPGSLQALVDAKILDALPVDHFSGDPLLYDRDRRIVWSVGPDAKDDGGEGTLPRTFGKDWVWEIPAPPGE